MIILGLDMYFVARKSEFESYGSWKRERNEQDKTNYPIELEIFKQKQDYVFTSTKIDYLIGYFRKFNALHSYIVKAFADGVDECQDIILNQESVENILNILKEIDKDHETAKHLMPCCDGFFFGGQEYDEWYFNDIKNAIELFTDILLNIDFGVYEIVYQASW